MIWHFDVQWLNPALLRGGYRNRLAIKPLGAAAFANFGWPDFAPWITWASTGSSRSFW